MTENSETNSLSQRLKDFYAQHEKRVDLAVFFGGFFFDVLTLSRPDDWFSVGQQFVYLILLLWLLKLEIRFEILQRPLVPWMTKWWPYRRFITHFLFGSLLSVYTILFFKSSSFMVSFVFILLIALIMVLNELPFVQNIGVKIRVVLWALCVGSFLAMHSPTLFGFIGWIPFTVSMALGAICIWALFHDLRKGHPEARETLKKTIMLPGLLTFLVYFMLYVLKLVPPVPLSLEYAGIYHRIERKGAVYELSYDRTPWKFWQNGAQDFRALPGDRVHAYVEIFAPSNFKDRVLIKWYYDEPKAGWTLYDSIPLTISGGRDGGFRGFAIKSNYVAGDWQIRAETSDGREIGRLFFEIETVAEAAETRNYRLDER